MTTKPHLINLLAWSVNLHPKQMTPHVLVRKKIGGASMGNIRCMGMQKSLNENGVMNKLVVVERRALTGSLHMVTEVHRLFILHNFDLIALILLLFEAPYIGGEICQKGPTHLCTVPGLYF